MFDGKAFGAEIVGVVKEYVSGSVAPLVERLEAMERRLDDMPTPQDGKDADPAEVAAIVSEGMKSELSEIRAAVEAIEVPELPDIPKMVADAVAAIPEPQDGKSVTVEDVSPLIEESVSKAVSELPKPKDGVDGEDGDPGEKGEPGRDGVDGKDGSQGEKGAPGSDGKDGRDGVDIADLVRGEDGRIIVTLSNGMTRDLGSFKGEKGEPGKDGTDGEEGARGPEGEKGAPGKDGLDGAAGERGERGQPGEDGRDGLGFDDMRFEYDGERTVSLIFERGEETKRHDMRLPIPIYREPYNPGKSYERGDVVSHGGSMWTAQKDTKEKPGETADWKLTVKRGRDGSPGKQGKPGKDYGTPFADKGDD